jgi:zinc protease
MPAVTILLGAALSAGLAGRVARAASGPSRPTPAEVGPKLDVKEWELPNGLKVLFLEDHKAPVVSVQVFYHVGSKDEREGQRGIAHMFEHMMYLGSDRVPPGDHARFVRNAGGAGEAFTTEDVTTFQQTVPASALGFALALEAERMRHLRLAAGTLDFARKVVLEERQRKFASGPFAQALESLRGAAFEGHPYRWTTSGVPDELEKVDLAACRAFYDAHYVPARATLVVVGDARRGEVEGLVKQHFGPLPRASAPPVGPPPPKRPPGLRDQTVDSDLSVPMVVGGYDLPPAAHPDLPALRILAAILAQGDGTRITQRLVARDGLAQNAGGLVEILEQRGQLLIFGVPLPGADVGRVREALLEEVHKVRKDGVTPEELARARSELTADTLRGLESAEGIASQLGEAATLFGNWRRFTETAPRLMAVDATDVKRVAERYLADDNLTLITLKAGGTTTRPLGRLPPVGKPR